MTMIPLSVANLCAIGLGFSSIIVACTEPLIRIANKYNFYLYPENDFFKYTPSGLHVHSQNLFIATSVFLGVAFVFALIDTLAEISGKSDDTHSVKGVTIGSLSVASVLYISAVSTLGRVVYNVVDYVENLPLPIPIKDVDIIYKIGSTMGTIGLLSTLMSLVLSVICLHQSSKRRSYVQLP